MSLSPAKDPGEGLWEQQERSQHKGGTILPLLTSCSVMLMRSSCCRNCSRMYLGAISTRDWKGKACQRWLGQPWQCSELLLSEDLGTPCAYVDTARLGMSTWISWSRETSLFPSPTSQLLVGPRLCHCHQDQLLWLNTPGC